MIDIRHTTLTQLELTGSGTIDRHDVRRAGDALATALTDGGRAVLLLDLRAVEDMSMRALVQDASLGRRLMPSLARLDRVALVGDVDWLDPLVSLQESVVPSLRVRRFTASDIDAARQWTTGRGDGAMPPGPDVPGDEATPDADGDAEPKSDARRGGATSFEGLFSSVFEALDSRSRERGGRSVDEGDGPGLRLEEHDGLLVLDLDGRIAREDLERVAARLDQAGKGGCSMLARLTRFEGVDPAALLSPALWRLQNDGLSLLSRVALVTSLEWLGRAIESVARRQRIEVRSFALGDEATAQAWLNEGRTD